MLRVEGDSEGCVSLDLGVPLLEENEMEEGQPDSVSLAIDNRSMTDNASFKLSAASPELG